MPSNTDLKSFGRLRVADSAGELVPKPPPLFDAIKKKFPDLAQELTKAEADFHDYMQKQVAMSINNGPK